MVVRRIIQNFVTLYCLKIDLKNLPVSMRSVRSKLFDLFAVCDYRDLPFAVRQNLAWNFVLVEASSYTSLGVAFTMWRRAHVCTNEKGFREVNGDVMQKSCGCPSRKFRRKRLIMFNWMRAECDDSSLLINFKIEHKFYGSVICKLEWHSTVQSDPK